MTHSLYVKCCHFQADLTNELMGEIALTVTLVATVVLNPCLTSSTGEARPTGSHVRLLSALLPKTAMSATPLRVQGVFV